MPITNSDSSALRVTQLLHHCFNIQGMPTRRSSVSAQIQSDLVHIPSRAARFVNSYTFLNTRDVVNQSVYPDVQRVNCINISWGNCMHGIPTTSQDPQLIMLVAVDTSLGVYTYIIMSVEYKYILSQDILYAFQCLTTHSVTVRIIINQRS